jgi:uncharacterized protein YyaL (SSP411 family)
MNDDLKNRIEEMRIKRGDAYTPRTRHFEANGRAKYTNRLFLESSPYLLQHAHNPVDWYPWGDEAFEAAKALDRPVLLSVGYSTCHWCHVMEEESFEDEEIARIINDNYIAVKVDREERPDVDAIYMAAVQALTGRGGWPMTVWLRPDRKPFYGATYFPARDGDRGAGVGFLTILKRLRESYDTRQDIVGTTSEQLSSAVQKMLLPEAAGNLPGEEILKSACDVYKNRFDAVHGGLSGAPKFPSSLPIRFLFRYFRHYNDKDALRMATTTLDKMAAGGIYDHVGGGFHRYATDERWLIPHFEKMLYDNALLAMDYLEGYQITQNPAYKQVVEEILAYVQRDMTSTGGAFFSATDADSLTAEGHRLEGYFFTWTLEELRSALGKDRFSIAGAYYLDGPLPNFEGRYILNRPAPEKDIAAKLAMDSHAFRLAVQEAKTILLKARSLRQPPLRDEKILTAWNGLMISAFARAGFVLDKAEYIKSAVDAATFVLSHLYVDNRLLRSYKDGHAGHSAFLEDYAFVTAGFIDLYEATHELKWLDAAIRLEQTLAGLFEDTVGGGYFATSNDHEKMIAREKPNYDGAVPCGNSVAVMNLLRLGSFTANQDYKKRAEKAFQSFAAILQSQPTALAEMLLSIDFYFDRPKEIVIVTPRGRREAARPFLNQLRRAYVPNRSLVVVAQGDDLNDQARLIPSVRGRDAIDNRATAYICRDNTCSLPVTDPNEFSNQIRAAHDHDMVK